MAGVAKQAPSGKTPLRGVIFDVDGVLCDSEPFLLGAAARLFAERFGIVFGKENMLALTGTGEEAFLRAMGDRHGVRLNMPKDKERLYDLYLEGVRGRLRPTPGVLDFIKRCHSAGVALGLATSADARKLNGNLEQLGIARSQFGAVLTGSDVAKRKPDPELFLEAARRLDLEPQACVVCEDAPAGIKAGRAAGSLCLGVTTSYRRDVLLEAGAQFVVPDFRELPGGLLSLLGLRAVGDAGEECCP